MGESSNEPLRGCDQSLEDSELDQILTGLPRGVS